MTDGRKRRRIEPLQRLSTGEKRSISAADESTALLPLNAGKGCGVTHHSPSPSHSPSSKRPNTRRTVFHPPSRRLAIAAAPPCLYATCACECTCVVFEGEAPIRNDAACVCSSNRWRNKNRADAACRYRSARRSSALDRKLRESGCRLRHCCGGAAGEGLRRDQTRARLVTAADFSRDRCAEPRCTGGEEGAAAAC